MMGYNEQLKELQIKSLYEDLSSFRTLVMMMDSDSDSEEMSTCWYKDGEFKHLLTRITDMAKKVCDIIIYPFVYDILGEESYMDDSPGEESQSGMLINLQKKIMSLWENVQNLFEEESLLDNSLSLYTGGAGEESLNLSEIKSLWEKSQNLFGMVINFQKEIESLWEEVQGIRNPPCKNNLSSRTASKDSVLEYLNHLMDYMAFNRLQIKSLYQGLTSFRSLLLKDSEEIMSWYKHHHEEGLKDLVIRIADMAKMAQHVINHPYIVKDTVEKMNRVYVSGTLINLQKQIESLKEEAHDNGENSNSNSNSSSRASKDFVLDNLTRLTNYNDIYNQFTEVKKLQIESVHKEVISLRIFLQHSEMRLYQHKELLDLIIQITDVAKEAKNIFDMSVESDIIEKEDRVAGTFSHVYQSGMLINVLKEIQSLKKEVSKIYEKKLYNIGDPHVGMYSGESSSSSSSSRANLPVVEDETVVGFDNDVDTIRERLVGGSKKLDVISIVGMAGSGKTTLAKQLYNDAFVVYHFYIRGWTYVSQVYAKRDLLLSILSSLVEHRDALYSMSDKKLVEVLYKSLKGKRYLIVMDDIWDTRAWNDLEKLFPNDNNGSRIIITSRLTEVALHAKPDSHPHPLHFLTNDESWELLKHKVFGKESCPPDLVEIGEQIAQKCQGLPLAIVLVAGLLARTHKKKEEWEKVAGSLSSHIATNREQWVNNTLELSYYHLPRHLRLCFLYFGAFPEDYEIPVRKLIWLWIAEGFIHQIGNKTLEDVAEEFLTDLIDRNLVLVAKRKFSGGIRACHVHDLLHDLCSRKGKEENFMQQIYRHETLSSNDSFPIGEKQRRLCIFSHCFDYISLKPCAPHVRSLLYFEPTWGTRSRNISWIRRAFKFLRVLDLSTIFFLSFPSEILQLVLLRYLELRGRGLTLPESISELLNLETLDVSNIMGVIPPYIWKMVNLRHLRIDGDDYAAPPNYSYPSTLHNLQTISQLCPTSCQVILARTPNLRKLGFYGHFKSKEGKFWFPDLHFLNHLEKLKLCKVTSCETPLYGRRWSLQGVNFPPNLRRLTLSRTELHWEEMSTLGMLCNLEVLKLEYSAFVGPRWETTGGGFQRLKFLRLIEIHIVQWEASNTDFPSLQQLVLRRCRIHKGIPFEFGDIPTLQRIEVDCCSRSTENSAKNIQEEQKNAGNDLLKIHIKSWESTAKNIQEEQQNLGNDLLKIHIKSWESTGERSFQSSRAVHNNIFRTL